MVFPWSRSDAAAHIPSADRRRGRGRRRQRVDAQRQSVRLSLAQRRQRLAFTIGGFLILLIFGIIGYGYYQEFYKPPREMAGEVNNVSFSMGDLVQRIRVIQGLTGQADLGVLPFQYLEDLIDAEVLRQLGLPLGLVPSGEEIEEILRSPPLYPEPPPGQETDSGQLEREFNQNYSTFLTRTGLSDKEYRTILQEQNSLQRLYAWIGAGIEDTPEQVEVEWINLRADSGIDPFEVRDRLDTENFADVAAELSFATDTRAQFADANGYVGWVPLGAFPSLDKEIFGDEEKELEPLSVGAFSDPIFTQEGIYIIHELSGLEERDLDDIMRTKLNSELVQRWQEEQRTRGAEDGWVKLNFDSKLYEWVAEQVRISAPRTQLGQ